MTPGWTTMRVRMVEGRSIHLETLDGRVSGCVVGNLDLEIGDVVQVLLLGENGCRLRRGSYDIVWKDGLWKTFEAAV